MAICVEPLRMTSRTEATRMPVPMAMASPGSERPRTVALPEVIHDANESSMS